MQIIKSDESSGKRISGVRFEVRKVNGEIVGTYTTDSDGIIYLPEIESGWYTVTELKAAPGYLLDTVSHRIEVKDGTQVNEKKIKAAGVAGVMRPSQTAIQVIIGTKVQFVADEMAKML